MPKRPTPYPIPWKTVAVLLGAAALIALSQWSRGWYGGEGPVMGLTVTWQDAPPPAAAVPSIDWRPIRTDPGFEQVGGGKLRAEDGRLMRVANGWRKTGGEKEELARMRVVRVDDTHAQLEIECNHQVQLEGLDGAAPEFRVVNPPDIPVPAVLLPGPHVLLLERIE